MNEVETTAKSFLLIQTRARPFEVPKRTVTREDIVALEQTIAESGLSVELPVSHHFSPGVYARELRIPAGCVLTGCTHRFENMNILVSGDMTVLVDDEMLLLSGYRVVVSPAGTKRVAYAHTDCVWVTVHGTHLTDLAEIEAALMEPERLAYAQKLIPTHGEGA